MASAAVLVRGGLAVQHFPVDFGNAAHTMLLVDSRIFKLGKDVLFDLLSYCGWGWFETFWQGERAWDWAQSEQKEEDSHLVANSL